MRDFRSIVCATLAVVSLLGASVHAEEGKPGFGPGKPGAGGFPGNPEEMRKQLMQRFDLNGDGTVDDSEKAKAMEQMKQAQPNLEQMKKMADRNGDGTIDAAEMAIAREMMMKMQQAGGKPQFGAEGQGFGGPSYEEQQAEMMKKFDKNGDGKLDDKERKAAAAAMKGKTRQQLIKEKLDKNGDGKIDEEEKAAAREEFKKGNKKE